CIVCRFVQGRSVANFFFSSRRRHTRLQGDWSSDVCSSDLEMLQRFKQELILARQITDRHVIRIFDLGDAGATKFITMEFIDGERSEERRVGKECRSRWSPDD